MLPIHYIWLSIVYWNSRWCYHTRGKSYNSHYCGSVISDWTTLMLYHQAKFVAYITDYLWEGFYHQKLVVAHFIIRELSCHRNCVSETVYDDVTPSCIISLYMVHRLYFKKSLSWYVKCIVEVVYDIWITSVIGCFHLGLLWSTYFIPKLFVTNHAVIVC